MTCDATTSDGDSCKNDIGEGQVYCHLHRWVTFAVTKANVARTDAQGDRITARTGEGVDLRRAIEQLDGCEVTGRADDPAGDEVAVDGE